MQQMYAELIVWKQTSDWQITELSNEFLALTGFSHEDVKDRFHNSFTAFFSEEKSVEIQFLLSNCKEESRFFSEIFDLKNNYKRELQIILQATRTKEGLVHICIIDITDNQSKRPLRQSAECYHIAMEQSAIVLAENVTEQVYTEVRFKEEEFRRCAMLYDQIFACQLNLSEDSVLEVNEDVFPFFKARVYNISGLIRQYANQWVHPDEREAYMIQFDISYLKEQYSLGAPELTFDYRVKTAKNEESYRWLQAISHIIKEPTKGQIYAYVYIKDIDKQKKLELKLRKYAEIDGLSGLYNRYTSELKCQTLLQKRKENQISAFIVLDLDGFKQVNDMYGHVCGDEVLKATAKKIKEIFENQDVLLGRLGGDEFFIFLNDLPKVEFLNQISQQLCDEIYALFFEPYDVTASIGVAVAPYQGISFEQLYSCADTALYSAKHKGKNGYMIYDNTMDIIGVKEKIPVSRDWLLEESNDIIYVSDFYSYDLLYMNHGAKELFNLKDDSYKGKKCYTVLQNMDQPCSFCTNHIICREEFYIWEYRNPLINRTLLLKDRIVDWYGRPARIEFATDITIVDGRREQLEKQLELHQAAITLFSEKLENISLKDMVMQLLEMTGRYYHADRVFIINQKEDEQSEFLKYIWCNQHVNQIIYSDIQKERFIQRIEMYLKNNRHFVMNNVKLLQDTDVELYDFYNMNRIHYQVIIPYFVHGRLKGYVGLDNPSQYLEETVILEALAKRLQDMLLTQGLQDKLEYLCFHDSLTSLQNRKRYIKYVKNLEDFPIKTLGVACADLNALKEINRYRGHAGGDVVVKNAAMLLCECFPDAQLFRLSGDEFLIFCENETEQQMRNGVQKVYDGSASLDAYGISIGYAWSNQEPEVNQLITQANDMMLIRKQLYYESAKMQHLSGKHGHDRLQILLDSIANGHYKMYLQPKVDCISEALTGAEALARYYSPLKGFVTPAQFVPELEQAYTIRYLDLFIFEEVCRLLEKWVKKGKKLVPISVNFSRLTLLEPDLLQTVQGIAEKYHIPKKLLELEITESIGDYEDQTIAEIGKKIKEAGFSLSLDDFGSHFTNMSVLTVVPTDVLKIDRSLIRDIIDNKTNKFLLYHLFSFCREMKIKSVAEGVEDRQQLELLQTMQCDEIQGFLFGKPMTVSEFEERFMK